MIGKWYRAYDFETMRAFIGLKILIDGKWFAVRGFELQK